MQLSISKRWCNFAKLDFWTPKYIKIPFCSFNIMLRVFSTPGGECVSIVLAGLASSRPPVQHSQEVVVIIVFLSIIPPLFKPTSGRFGRDPILGTQTFFQIQVPKIVFLPKLLKLFRKSSVLTKIRKVRCPKGR